MKCQTQVVYFYSYFSGIDSFPDSNISNPQKITLKNHKNTCITVTSVLEIGKIGKALGNVNNFQQFDIYIKYVQKFNKRAPAQEFGTGIWLVSLVLGCEKMQN